MIGAITCKKDKNEVDEKDPKEVGVYLMTITVLKPYRRYGLASKMLKDAMEDYKNDPDIKSVFLDVQSNNECALKFYEKHGFEVVKERKDYYTNIEPADSFFLRKSLRD